MKCFNVEDAFSIGFDRYRVFIRSLIPYLRPLTCKQKQSIKSSSKVLNSEIVIQHILRENSTLLTYLNCAYYT